MGYADEYSVFNEFINWCANIFADVIFDCNIFSCIFTQILLKFASRVITNNKPALVHVTAGAEEAISHCLNQGWPSSMTHVCHNVLINAAKVSIVGRRLAYWPPMRGYNRLFSGLLPHPWRQPICLSSGICNGLPMAFGKKVSFPTS